MIITPLPHDELPLLTSPDAGFVRSPGLHMSQLYGAFYEALEPKKYGGPRDDKVMANYMGAGLALEAALEAGLRERLTAESGRPGEFIHKERGISTPIIFSPDIIIFNSHTRVGEIKLTWMSSSEVPHVIQDANTFPPKFAKYFTQMMLYCRCLETPYARLYGFFVNGGYEFLRHKKGEKSKPPQPAFYGWDLEFSKREMDDEWAMIINHARSVKLL